MSRGHKKESRNEKKKLISSLSLSIHFHPLYERVSVVRHFFSIMYIYVYQWAFSGCAILILDLLVVRQTENLTNRKKRKKTSNRIRKLWHPATLLCCLCDRAPININIHSVWSILIRAKREKKHPETRHRTWHIQAIRHTTYKVRSVRVRKQRNNGKDWLIFLIFFLVLIIFMRPKSILIVQQIIVPSRYMGPDWFVISNARPQKERLTQWK